MTRAAADAEFVVMTTEKIAVVYKLKEKKQLTVYRTKRSGYIGIHKQAVYRMTVLHLCRLAPCRVMGLFCYFVTLFLLFSSCYFWD